MKIVSWNIGNFIWLKYLPGKSHYAFQMEDIEEVTALLQKENADVIFLQEVPMGKDVDILAFCFKDHPFMFSIPAYDKDSVSLFLSRYPVKEVHHTNSNEYIINSVTFFPIHLNAFSPKSRLNHIQKLLPDLPESRGIILGDTNFWILNGFFISRRDKSSYQKIVHNHIDILRHLGATCRFFLSLDKIFVTEDLSYSHPKIIKHRIGHIDHYMISTIISM